MSSTRSRGTVFVCMLLVLDSALVFSVAADAPFVVAATAAILVVSLIVSKPLPRTSRAYVYLGTGVAMLTVLGNQVFALNDDRFFMLPVEIYGPGLLYFAAALTLFDERETTLAAILAAALVTLMLSGNVILGDVNEAMPFSNGLLRSFSAFYGAAVVLAGVLSLWLLHRVHRRVVHRPVGRAALFGRRIWLLAAIVCLGGFVLGGRELTLRNEAVIRRFFFSFMGDLFRFRRGGYFGERSDLRDASRLRAEDFDRIVLRAVGEAAPGYLRARAYVRYLDGSWRAHEDGTVRRLTEFMDDPDVAELQFRLPEAVAEPGPHKRKHDFSVYVADASLRRRLPVPGNFQGVAAVADSVAVDIDGTLEVEDWERSGGYTVERPAAALVAAYPKPDPADMQMPESYLQLPEDIAADLRVVADRILGPVPGGGESSLSTTRRIVEHFNRNYTYDLEAGPPPGDDPVLAFLQRGDRGHCELFAAGTALLLRARGIPARYVVGFVCVEPGAGQGYWLARRRDAHAWAEAYLPEHGGWTLIEATPASGVPDGASRFSAFGAWLDRVTLAWQEFFAGVKRGYAAREILRVFRGLASLAGRVLTHPVGGGLAVVLLASTLVLFRRRRERVHGRGAPPQLVALRERLDRLENRLAHAAGRRRPASMPIQDFVHELDTANDPTVCELRNLLADYVRLRYSGAWRDDAQVSRFMKRSRGGTLLNRGRRADGKMSDSSYGI